MSCKWGVTKVLFDQKDSKNRALIIIKKEEDL